MVKPKSESMAAPLPITTDCYRTRVRELKQLLQQLQHQARSHKHGEEMDALLNHQIRSLYASLWALHAELEED